MDPFVNDPPALTHLLDRSLDTRSQRSLVMKRNIILNKEEGVGVCWCLTLFLSFQFNSILSVHRVIISCFPWIGNGLIN
jgi:hypothetical protein